MAPIQVALAYVVFIDPKADKDRMVDEGRCASQHDDRVKTQVELFKINKILFYIYKLSNTVVGSMQKIYRPISLMANTSKLTLILWYRLIWLS